MCLKRKCWQLAEVKQHNRTSVELLPTVRLFCMQAEWYTVYMINNPMLFVRERERELRKEGREVPSRVRLREGPIGVRITLGQPTIR